MIEIIREKISKISQETVKEIVNVFNSAFSTNKGSILRDEKSWLWRYKERPDSEDDQIILAKFEDKIVGVIIVTFREIKINNENFKFGMIDDVATLPEFRKRGIAKKMLQEAVEFIQERKCDASALCADPKGKAIKIYRSFNYQDSYYIQSFILPGHPFQLFKDIPIFTGLFPVYYLWYFFVKNKKSLEKKLKIETLKEEEIKKYTYAINSFYSDFQIFKEEYLLWKHFKTPHKNILLYASEDEKIKGAISLIVQKCRFSKYKIDVGYINEIFFEEEEIGYLLFSKISEFARKEKIPILQCSVSFNNNKIFSFFKKLLAIKIGNGVFMVKNINSDCLSYFTSFKYVMNEHTIGIP
jgi:ribosomal protein S18 acetylase RimI-like enzyme